MEYSSYTTKKKDWDIDSKKDGGFIRFSNGPKNNDRLKVSKTRNVVSTNGNDCSHVNYENSNVPLASTSYVTCDSAIVESAESSDQNDPIESFILSATDANILKSVRTYAKKKESISPILYDKSDNETEKQPKNSKYNKNCSKKKSLKTHRDKSNPSKHSNGIIENADSCDGFNTTNGFGILTDIDDRVFSLYNSPHEFEPSNHSGNDSESPFPNEVASNGYSRTRKNLKHHLVEREKYDSDSEDDASEVTRPNPSRTFGKATRKKQNSLLAFLPNGSHKITQVRKISKEGSPSDSSTLKSPVVVIERMSKNLCVNSVSSNSKPRLSMLDMVQRLSVNRKKEISETSSSATTSRLATPSSLENNSYADLLDTPSPAAKKRRPDTPLPKGVSGHSLDTTSPVAENQRPDAPELIIANNKRSALYDRSLDIVKRPRVYPECDSNVWDVDDECSLARSYEKSSKPAQNSLVKATTLNNCTNSKTVSVENISKQEPFTFLQKESNSHTCTKKKLIHVPILVCDCGDSNSTNNSNNLMPSLAAHVSNFASSVANIVKQNPDNLQPLSSSHINAFCDSVKRLFLQNSCELFGVHPSIATNALDSNTKDKCQEFIENAFILHKECSYKMMTSFIHNFDVCEQLTVKHFCSNPNVVRFMSEFFRSDKFSLVSVSENNFQFKFPENYESPFCLVVKDYTRYFVKKIWPLGSKKIANSLIMEYAYKNMSNVEIIIVSFFFLKKDLLTLKAFISRFTYVAVLSVYKYYNMIISE